MPTLYTSLREKHRHPLRIAEDDRNQLSWAPRTGPLLATERALQTTDIGLKPGGRIGIVGAGLAGLCAAYELHGMGYDVTVFEARARVGGRVHSRNDVVPDRWVECGGELIGSNHPLWQFYKTHFKLEFSNVRDYGNSPIRLDGRTLSFEQSKRLMDHMERELKLLTDLAQTIVDPFEPWTNADASALDRLSLDDWLARSKSSAVCRRAVAAQLSADNGVPSSQQSLLGILAMVRGGGLDRYWTDTELYRCKGGNQKLPEAFANVLNSDPRCPRVLLNSPVEGIQRASGKAILSVRSTSGATDAHFDDVILAIPPSAWHRIDTSTEGPLEELMRSPPPMGSNVKYIMRLQHRIWQDFASSPNLTEDGPLDLTWETTEEERKGDFALVAFSGAADADECRNWKRQARRTHYVEALKPYPGIDRAIKADEFFDWPGEPWTEASYYFPRVGEVTKWGPFWRAGYDGWLHFAGEHTCFAFVGYMEGALSSGYRLARRLAVRDGLLMA